MSYAAQDRNKWNLIIKLNMLKQKKSVSGKLESDEKSAKAVR